MSETGNPKLETVSQARIDLELVKLAGDNKRNLSNFPGLLPGGVRRLLYSPEHCPVPRDLEKMDVAREALGGRTERELFADIDNIILTNGIDLDSIADFLQGDPELGGGYRWDVEERVEDLLIICGGLWEKGYPFDITCF